MAFTSIAEANEQKENYEGYVKLCEYSEINDGVTRNYSFFDSNLDGKADAVFVYYDDILDDVSIRSVYFFDSNMVHVHFESFGKKPAVYTFSDYQGQLVKKNIQKVWDNCVTNKELARYYDGENKRVSIKKEIIVDDSKTGLKERVKMDASAKK